MADNFRRLASELHSDDGSSGLPADRRALWAASHDEQALRWERSPFSRKRPQ